MSDHHRAAATGDNNLGSPPPSAAADLENPPSSRDSSPAALPALIIISLFAASLTLMATVALILSVQTEYEVDSFHVSSFNISDSSWSADLSLSNQSEGGLFADPDVAYEARSWLYSRGGFVSVGAPSMIRGRGGLSLRSNFTMRRQVAEETGAAAGGGGIVILDLLIEANATRRTASSYLTIECGDLKIEFAASRSFGMLIAGGAERCGAQVYATKSDALKGGRIVDMLRRLLYYLVLR